jgi:hypothetical protein
MIQSNKIDSVYKQNLLIILFITTITFIANYVTNFNTILLPGVLITLYLLYKESITSFKPLELIKYLLFIIATTILLNIKYIGNDLNFNIIAWGDKSFYAQVSAFINETGIETYYFDYINTLNRKPIPYHYGENWLTILFSKIFRLNEFYAQELIATPFLVGTSLFFINNIYKRKGYYILNSLTFSLTTLFFTSLPLLDYSSIPWLGDMIIQFQIDPLSYNKHLFSITLLSFFFDSISANNWKVSSVSVIIALFSFLCCISFINILIVSILLYVFDKNISIKEKILIVFIVIICVLYFIYFYFIQTSIEVSSNYNATDLSFFNNCINPTIYFRTISNIIGKSILQIVLVYLPVILYIMFNIKRIYVNQIHLLILTVSILLTGLALWAIMWLSIGSISLFIDASFWAFKLSLFLIFFIDIRDYYSFKKNFPINKFSVFIAILILPSLYNLIKQNKSIEGEEFINLVEKISLKNKYPIIYIRVYNPNKSFYDKNLLAATSLGPISNYNSKHHGIFVDIDNINYSKDCLILHREQPLINSSCFVKYCKINKFKNYRYALSKIVKDYKIKYIIKDKDYNESIVSNLNTKKIYENATTELLEII